MQLGKVFDQEVPQDEDFQPLPAGWYTAQIENAEVKETKSGTGHYLNVRYKITGPSHAGRVVFGMITVNNNNRQAEEIGEQQMNKLRVACGLKKLTDTEQLAGKTLNIKLKIKKDEVYGDKNEITAWSAVEGGNVPAPPENVPKFENTQAVTDVPPWG